MTEPLTARIDHAEPIGCGDRGGVIDFYFDFISPYGYFAAMQIEALARRHDCTVRWHVFRLGVVVVKVMGLRPMMETPLKSSYVLHDIVRLAKLYDLPIVTTAPVPDPVLLGSAFYVVANAQADALPSFTKAVYGHLWQRGRAIDSADDLTAIAHDAGMQADALFSIGALKDGRARLKLATERAIAQGIFGSPTFVVGKEVIWGVDRLWMLEHYLSHEATRPVEQPG